MVSSTDKKQQKQIDALKKRYEELRKELADRDFSFEEFVKGSEEYRKRVLREKYEEFKQKYQWPFGEEIPDPEQPPQECDEGYHWDDIKKKCVPDEAEPVPEPEPTPEPEPEPGPTPEPEPTPTPGGNVIFDSHRDTALHDGKVRTIDAEGELETRASGDPKIQVNNDNTFSLICKTGHGRIYPYYRNYNSALEIECAFWQKAPGQDLSLKLRSRHNEAPDDRPDAKDWSGVHGDAFGGPGVSVDDSGWGAKIEPEHNFHPKELAKSGKLPKKFPEKQYFKIYFSVEDIEEGGKTKIKQLGKIDYNDGNGWLEFMEKIDTPKDFMIDKKLYDAKSYFWLRQNIDSGTGEIRFKSVRLTAL